MHPRTRRFITTAAAVLATNTAVSGIAVAALIKTWDPAGMADTRYAAATIAAAAVLAVCVYGMCRLALTIAGELTYSRAAVLTSEPRITARNLAAEVAALADRVPARVWETVHLGAPYGEVRRTYLRALRTAVYSDRWHECALTAAGLPPVLRRAVVAILVSDLIHPRDYSLLITGWENAATAFIDTGAGAR